MLKKLSLLTLVLIIVVVRPLLSLTLMYYHEEYPGGYVILPDLTHRGVLFEKSDFGIPPDSVLPLEKIVVKSGVEGVEVTLGLWDCLPSGRPNNRISESYQVVLHKGWNDVLPPDSVKIEPDKWWVILECTYSFLLTEYSYPAPSEHSWIVLAGGAWDRAPYEIAIGVVIKGGTGIAEGEEQGEVPRIFSMGQNYPNPFNPQTTIPFTIQETSRVVIEIFDLRGRRVATLLEKEVILPGEYRVVWDGMDGNRVPVSSGIYFCRLTGRNVGGGSEETIIRKLLLTR